MFTQWAKIVLDYNQYMERNKEELFFLKEDDSLSYNVYHTQVVKQISGLELKQLKNYTEWIKPQTWHHRSILECQQLNLCPHLTHTEPPRQDITRPSETSLNTHEEELWRAQGNPKMGRNDCQRIRDGYAEMLHLHGHHEKSKAITSLPGPLPPPPPTRDTPTQPWTTPKEAAPMDTEDTPAAHSGSDSPTWGDTMEREEEQQWKQEEARCQQQPRRPG